MIVIDVANFMRVVSAFSDVNSLESRECEIVIGLHTGFAVFLLLRLCFVPQIYDHKVGNEKIAFCEFGTS